MKDALLSALPYFARYRRGLAVGAGALLLKDLFSAGVPLLMRGGVDALTRGGAWKAVLGFAAAMLLLNALKGFFQYHMRVILVGISRDIEYDLRNDIFAKLAALDASFYARFRTGDIMARATNDLNAVRMMLGPGLMYWFETMITFFLAVGVMLWVDWRLTLVALLPAPLVSYVVLHFGRVIHDRFEAIQEQFSDISSRVQENLSGVRIIRAYAREPEELALFEKLNRDYIGANLKLARETGVFYPLMEALIALTFLLVLLFGGWRVLEGKLSFGSFVMFQMYMNMLVWPMIAFGWVTNLMQRGTASMTRIRAMLDEIPRIAAPADPVPLPEPLAGAIEFDRVSVSYSDGAPALSGLNLRIPAGSTVAIAGHTGSGKTTLVQLIPRLLDPTEGTVRIDGIDLRTCDPPALRRQIAVVPQETFLFSTTIAENIAFGVSGASSEVIRTAAERAGLGPDLAGFPKGLETLVGERGITLSGGQKQRVAIARALLRDPRILILDDALSSVDTVTEERILAHLAEMMSGRTAILISHRVSTLRLADRIYVIENGSLAEQGTHDQLLAHGGYYADLYEKQQLEEELETAE